jgi:glycosyltransferase involved in cell wall biosynthesis
LRVALIHSWIVTWRGGERVLRAIADLFPGADIFTHVADPKLISREFSDHKVSTTFISRLPFARKFYRHYLPLMPLALEQLDLRAYDLIISSEAGPAKGVIISPDATHICYCHSPLRYAWDMSYEYRAHMSYLTRMFSVPLMHYMRMWDQLSAQRVDRFVANSHFVARRIEKYYRRSATVIYPPVDVESFDATKGDEGFYLAVGQLVSYKRFDLLVQAFNVLGKPLVIIGEGEMGSKLRRMAAPNVRLMGWQPFDVIRDHLARCRALVFPGIEDFGIVPVEAMASGKPVIAFEAGGARDTIVNGVTGLFFREQTVGALVEAVNEFDARATEFDRRRICVHASQFSAAAFKNRFEAFVTATLADRLHPLSEMQNPRVD